MLAMAIGATTADAQRIGPSGWDSRLYYSSQLLGPTNPIDKPSREYSGIPVAGWQLYANMLTSVVYDDNVFQTSTAETAATGLRLQPAVAAIRNDGIHQTTIYGFGDLRFYDQSDADVFNVLGGVNHVWEVQRDLIVRLSGDIARQTDITNGGIVEVAGAGAETLADPLSYNQFSGGASIYKSFDLLYVAVGGSIVGTTYDDLETALGVIVPQSYRNQAVYGLTERLGVFVSPSIYAFVEPSQNWRRFNDATFNSAGQRVVAGVGTDRVSLFSGEIFGGYQWQDYDTPEFGDVSGSVFGGRLFWYPTRELTFGIEADRSIGDSTLFTPGNPVGSPVQDTSIALRGDYIVSDMWTVAGRIGYDLVSYTATPRRDNQWLIGTTLSYFIWRDLAATLNYQHLSLESNFSENDFNRNIYTLGAVYKF